MTTQVTNSKLTALRIDHNDNSAEHCIRKNQLERLNGIRRGDALVCTSGVIWVTQRGDVQDHILKVGEKFVVERNDGIVVQTLSDKACWKFSNN